MPNLNCFSGGLEISEQAINILDELLSDKNSELHDDLRAVLMNYKGELIRKSSGIPFILSRMNLDISKSLQKKNIILTNTQTSKLKQLTSLSTIHYGY